MSRERVPEIRSRRMGFFLAVFIAIVWSSCAVASSMPPIRPVAAVQKGERGIGKTVVSGTTVEEFGVEVLGIVAGVGPSDALILVRTFGPLIERTGGIAAGMSGSPVFIDGHLVGALAYGFSMADHTLGLVTPIDDMLRVRELLTRDGASSATSMEHQASAGPWSGIVVARYPEEADALRSVLPAHVGVAVPLATPLAVSGLGQRTKRILESSLPGWSMFGVPGGKTPSTIETPELEPGSAVGVQLVRGDVNLTALGTVTFVDGNGFVAFGHPLMNRGSVDFFATGAYVHEVVQSVEVPFKIGAPLQPVGRLSQDRQAGVAGVLGELPQTIAVTVEVYDVASETLTQLSAEIANDEGLTVPLLAITLLEGFDRAIDRIGAGTATVTATIEGEGLLKPLIRDNLFYSASDISAVSLGELLLGVHRLLANEYIPVGLKRIDIRADIEPGRRTARIESARPKARKVVAGEAVEIEVSLRPFREEPITHTLVLEIPPSTPPGEVTVFVRGGGYGAPRVMAGELAGQLGESGLEPDEDDEGDVSSTAMSFEGFLAALFEADRNYEIVAEFYPLPSEHEFGIEGETPRAPHMSPDEGITAKQEQKAPPGLGQLFAGEAMFEPVKARLIAPYYIQGAVSLPLEILPDVGNDEGTVDSTECDEQALRVKTGRVCAQGQPPQWRTQLTSAACGR